RGELDLNPNVKIVTTIGDATVEQDTLGNNFYYLITYSNGVQTNNWVQFKLYHFNLNETVYIRIRPIPSYTYGPNDTLGPIIINADSQAYNWTPGPEIQTGISLVDAGNIRGDTFHKRTLEQQDKNLTLEKVVTGRFHDNYPDTFTVYFTDQFFQGLNRGPNYPATFAGCVKTAAIESWQKQAFESNYNKLLIRDYLVFKSLFN
ncbi:MAG: hypothetical protein ABIK67_01675, partial [candidate division WOR-3 bacterium]